MRLNAAQQQGGSKVGVSKHFLHRDHLGSVDTVTDFDGSIVSRHSFDAFGKRRQLNWQDDPEDTLLYDTEHVTNRGYTGHEQLDHVGLIHMNGRVYDPKLGRFLSADPNVQFAESTQGLNRYAYVNNNPLSYTDPSGFFLKKLFKKFVSAVKHITGYELLKRSATARMVLQVGAAFVPGVGAVFASILASAFNTYVVSGDIGLALQSGFISGFTAVVSAGIGDFNFYGVENGTLELVQRAVAHGVVGGVTAEIQGGRFKDGFKSSAITKLLSPGIEKATGEGSRLGILGAALVGGTISEIGGGKFANGAVTAAIQYRFNQVGETLNSEDGFGVFFGLKAEADLTTIGSQGKSLGKVLDTAGELGSLTIDESGAVTTGIGYRGFAYSSNTANGDNDFSLTIPPRSFGPALKISTQNFEVMPVFNVFGLQIVPVVQVSTPNWWQNTRYKVNRVLGGLSGAAVSPNYSGD